MSKIVNITEKDIENIIKNIKNDREFKQVFEELIVILKTE